jgi:hypothetical protein
MNQDLRWLATKIRNHEAKSPFQNYLNGRRRRPFRPGRSRDDLKVVPYD